jgi:hypothetical protein
VSSKICLRCDWSGQTDAGTCPRCGTVLYEPRRTATPTVDPDANDVVPARPVPPPPEARRSWPPRLAVAAVALFAVAAFAFVQLHGERATSVSGVAGRDGYLIVATQLHGTARLWVWDLAAGTAAPGPILARVPDELVESVSLQDTWIGLTTSTSSGGQAASVLRDLGPTDHPVDLARGRFIAWSTATGYVSVLRSRLVDGCRHDLTVRTWFVSIGHAERRYAGRVCGVPVAFGRDRLVPFVALDAGGRLRIAQVGNDYLVTRLHGRSILSVSSDGDLLVQRPGGVVAWSLDASRAYVLGTQAGVHGVFRLTVGTQPRPRPPQLVAATSAVDVAAAAGAEGDLFLATDGVIRRWHDGSLHAMPLPDGMPRPAGPLLWVSTLPYSSSGV